jgi:hypothetical protein
MSLNFVNAIVYDIETFPNCFTFSMEMLNSDVHSVWEISEFRDDRKQLLAFFKELATSQTPMIGFNNINFDYPVIHFLWNNPSASYQQLYTKAMDIINADNKFGHIIWASDRFTPQVDLFKMHHFDNKAKATSLKALQINMRAPFVQDMPIKDGTVLTKEQVETLLIPYNIHDVQETKRFAKYAHHAIEFRQGLEEQFGVDVYNWNDTKIGEQTIIQRLGDEVCYDMSTGRRKMRQTPRTSVALKDVIFPYVNFKKPEFKHIYDYMCAQTLKSDELNATSEDSIATIKSKGVFTDLTTTVGNVEYHYGTGGIHGSVEKKRIQASADWWIVDVDVSSLYPSIAIVNRLHPEHLGTRFADIYGDLKKERKKWQKEKGKKCTEANAIKLALNGAYGKSNSIFSVFYDPKFTMSITVNGQLMLSMLLEQLLDVPTLQVIQANTDGITYYIHKNNYQQSVDICNHWQELTGLQLEEARYDRMYIRDVNNYIAVSGDSNFKLKGAYWTPSAENYFEDIASAQPPAWHKDFSNVVSVRAAVANMINGIDIETFIKTSYNPYDFCCSAKARGGAQLFWGNMPVQKNTRYYISKEGEYLSKRMAPAGPVGAYKRRNGITETEYNRVMAETGGEWDERVCTKNKSKYEERVTGLAAGYKVTVVNDIETFKWDNINYDWYIQEAQKLII